MVKVSDFENSSQFQTSTVDGPFSINSGSICTIQGTAFIYTIIPIDLWALLRRNTVGLGVGLGICWVTLWIDWIDVMDDFSRLIETIQSQEPIKWFVHEERLKALLGIGNAELGPLLDRITRGGTGSKKRPNPTFQANPEPCQMPIKLQMD